MDNLNDPTNDKLCYYCGIEPASEKHKFEKEMWFVTERTTFPAGIKFKEAKIPIDRCESCEGKHHKWYIGGGALVIGVIAWFIIAQSFTWPHTTVWLVWVLTILGAAVIAGLFYAGFMVTLFKPIFKIPRESEVNMHMTVAQLMDEGWITSKPDPKYAKVGQPRAKKKIKEEDIDSLF